jgi:hypothetical protein
VERDWRKMPKRPPDKPRDRTGAERKRPRFSADPTAHALAQRKHKRNKEAGIGTFSADLEIEVVAYALGLPRDQDFEVILAAYRASARDWAEGWKVAFLESRDDQ